MRTLKESLARCVSPASLRGVVSSSWTSACLNCLWVDFPTDDGDLIFRCVSLPAVTCIASKDFFQYDEFVYLRVCIFTIHYFREVGIVNLRVVSYKLLDR